MHQTAQAHAALHARGPAACCALRLAPLCAAATRDAAATFSWIPARNQPHGHARPMRGLARCAMRACAAGTWPGTPRSLARPPCARFARGARRAPAARWGAAPHLLNAFLVVRQRRAVFEGAAQHVELLRARVHGLPAIVAIARHRVDAVYACGHGARGVRRRGRRAARSRGRSPARVLRCGARRAAAALRESARRRCRRPRPPARRVAGTSQIVALEAHWQLLTTGCHTLATRPPSSCTRPPSSGVVWRVASV